ncbi:hypothetical protein GF373_17475 [bacterium]|nr:hypothetical protein [bacterium]
MANYQAGNVIHLSGVWVGDGNTRVFKNESDDLVLEDANAGAITLTALKSMRNVWIEETDQSPGDITLSGVDWDCEYSFISSIKVQTDCDDWDLYLCEDDGFVTSGLSTRYLAANRQGDFDITVAREYNPGTDKVYIKYVDNTSSGVLANFYITGEARRH